MLDTAIEPDSDVPDDEYLDEIDVPADPAVTIPTNGGEATQAEIVEGRVTGTATYDTIFVDPHTEDDLILDIDSNAEGVLVQLNGQDFSYRVRPTTLTKYSATCASFLCRSMLILRRLKQHSAFLN